MVILGTVPLISEEHVIDSGALWRILHVTRNLAIATDLPSLLAQVIDAARQVLGAERGTVFLYDEDSYELCSRVATESQEIRIPADQGIAGLCASTRQIVNVPDCYADPRFNRKVDIQTGYRTRNLLAIPLIGHDQTLVGVMQVLNKELGPFNGTDEQIATILAAQCAVALQRARLIEQNLMRLKMQRDLALARDIQQRILPHKMPKIAGYDLAGMSRPAEETGGDIYDAIALEDGHGLFTLADVTGHGIGPALVVTQIHSMVRISARFQASLDTMFHQINHQLCDDLPDGRFATVMLGRLDPVEHVLKLHSAGQGPLIHFVAATGECRMISATTVPMGVIRDLGKMDPMCIELAPGDIFAAITDGVFEAKSPADEQYGSDRLAEVLGRCAGEPAGQIIKEILRAVDGYMAGEPQGDDITMLLIKRM